MNPTKANPQQDCVPFNTAVSRMQVLNQDGLLVKYFKVIVVSASGNKLTLTFDPATMKKKARATK